MLLSHQSRRGRFLHVVLGMVVGAAVMAVVAGLIAAVNLEISRAEQEREVSELRRQVEQLRIETQLAQARQDAERIREDIESRERRIRDLQEAVDRRPSLAGRVQTASGDLATIDLGANSGLSKDRSVRVYRSALMQEWVGTLQILRIEPDKAHGLFTPAHQGDEVRAGDVVVAAKPRQ